MTGLVTLSALIVLALGGWVIHRIARKPDPRGTEPGSGYTVIDANFASGMGGHAHQWHVPRDPQEYAKAFVPPKRRR